MALAALLAGGADAQQLPQITQYLINDYMINPAIGGSRNYFEAKLNHRQQWVGITDAPRTNILSLQGPIVNNKMGVGSYLFTDIAGPTRRIGLNVSYAYHLTITEKIKLSLGLSGGIIQFAVDGAKITSQETGDIAISSGLQSVLVPDAAAGVYLYADNFYFGISSPQLLNNKLKFFENYEDTPSKMVSHFYGLGGYMHTFGDFMLSPSVLVKYVYPITPQVQVSLEAMYKEMVWIAVGYRSQDAISLTGGYNFQNNIMVGYSYDITTSGLREQTSGTHEVMLGVRFKHHQKQTAPSTDGAME